MNELLSAAGALISVYIVFALLTSHASEAISALLNKRGRSLYDGIVALLGSTQRTATAIGAGASAGVVARSLTEHLYSHPLISTLGGTGTKKPSYIEPRTFTLSLVAVLRDTVAIAAKNDAQGNPIVLDVRSTPETLLDDLQSRVVALGPDDPTCKSLTLVLQDAAKTYDGALDAIDDWFNTQMDRVSGVYRRWIGGVQALIALVLIGVADADTIGILQQLFANTTVVNKINAAVAAGRSTDAVGQLQSVVSSGLVLGWSHVPSDGPAWAAKVGGLLLTWGAVLLGAPFWFDLLKQIVPVRATGAKPAASASRDAQAGKA
ncbi:MAG: hypothetical protein PVSMB8_12960 [Vulcanimicrobiaceae bacterium]